MLANPFAFYRGTAGLSRLMSLTALERYYFRVEVEQSRVGVLARAHSQSPAAAAIRGYLGNSDNCERAIVDWSMAYADQPRADFELLRDSS